METLVSVLVIEIQQDEKATPLGTGTLPRPSRPRDLSVLPLPLCHSSSWESATGTHLNICEGKCRPESPSASPIPRPSRWSPSASRCHPWPGSGSRPASLAGHAVEEGPRPGLGRVHLRSLELRLGARPRRHSLGLLSLLQLAEPSLYS